MANAKHISMYYLQQQNIEEKWWKPLTSQTESSIENDESSIHEISYEPSKKKHIDTKETKSTIQIKNEKMRDRDISDPQQYAPPIQDDITEIKSVVDSLIHDISTKR